MDDRIEILGQLRNELAQLIKAERESMRLCMARGAMPISATRAQSTTAEARWARAAEWRDRVEQRVINLVDRANLR